MPSEGKVMMCEACDHVFPYSSEIGEAEHCPNCNEKVVRIDEFDAIARLYNDSADIKEVACPEEPVVAEVIPPDFERKHTKSAFDDIDSEELRTQMICERCHTELEIVKGRENNPCPKCYSQNFRRATAEVTEFPLTSNNEGRANPVEATSANELSNPYQKIILPKTSGSLVEHDTWTNYRKETIGTKIKDQFLNGNASARNKKEDSFQGQIRNLIINYSLIAICILGTIGIIVWSFWGRGR